MMKDERVEQERQRLAELFKDIPPNKLRVAEGLILQAARLRILLNDMWQDIAEHGDVELFSQSEKLEPYERERPVAKLYNVRDQSYQRVIRQLIGLLPEEVAKQERKLDDLL